MPKLPANNPFVSQLLRQDQAVSETSYQEYRMQLEQQLQRAEWLEQITRRVAVSTGILLVTLMFVGGSRLVGSFDPWSNNANAISISLGVVYLICVIACPLSIASYYSRYRPQIRGLQDQVRDASFQLLRSEIAELRKQVEQLTRAMGRDNNQA